MPRLFEDDHKSPKWVWQPSLGGAFGVLVLLVLHLLPDGADPYLAWGNSLVLLIAMGLLARAWHRRLPVTPHELEYVRVGIAVLTVLGIPSLSGGAIPLSFIAGPAFWIWTVVENRRTPSAGGR